MNFLKKYIIVIVILAVVLGLEFWTDKSLNMSINTVKNMIQSIANKIDEGNIEDAKKEFFVIQKYWKSRLNILSFFTEHGELEKINNCLARIEGNFKIVESDNLLENIEELKFLLEHLQEKTQLRWRNVF